MHLRSEYFCTGGATSPGADRRFCCLVGGAAGQLPEHVANRDADAGCTAYRIPPLPYRKVAQTDHGPMNPSSPARTRHR